MMDTPSTTEFMNVDLELHCESGLQDLVLALGTGVVELHKTEKEAYLELAEHPRTVEDALLRFAELIHSLPPAARAVWERCGQRRFDVGIHAGLEPHSMLFTVSPRAVRLLAELGAELAFTVYAPDLTARSG